MTVLNKILDLLDSSYIKYTLSEHEPTISSLDAARIRNVDLKTSTKAMVAKSKENYFLLALPGNTKINWRKFKKLLGSKDISLASLDEVEKLTGLERGSIPPFGNILGFETYFDKKVLENEYVNFNAGSLTHSINMKCTDLIRLVQPKIEDFAD